MHKTYVHEVLISMHYVISCSVTVLLCVLLVLLCTVSLQSIGAALPIIILCTNKHFFLSKYITVLIPLYVNIIT